MSMSGWAARQSASGSNVRGALEWAAQVVGPLVSTGRVAAMPWSTSIFVTSARGQFWLKIAAPHTAHREVTVLRMLSETSSRGFPHLSHSSVDDGYLLTEHVDGRALEAHEMKRAFRVVQNLASEAARVGIQDVLPHLTVADAAQLVASALQTTPSRLDDPELARGVVFRLRSMTDKFDAADIALSDRQLVHGDLHAGNAIVTFDNEVVVLDWAEARYGSRVWDASMALNEITDRCGLSSVFLGSLKSLLDLLDDDSSHEEGFPLSVRYRLLMHRSTLARKLLRSSFAP